MATPHALIRIGKMAIIPTISAHAPVAHLDRALGFEPRGSRSESCRVHQKNLTLSLNLHSGQDEVKLLKIWSKITKIPSSNLRKTFIKPEGLGYRKNILYHGTAKINVLGQGSTYKLFSLLGALSEYLSDVHKMNTTIEHWIPKLPHA